MVERLKNTVLLLWDNYPGYSTSEAEFIERTLSEKGYTVKRISLEDISTIGGNFAFFYGQVLVVPNCSNLPLSVKKPLKIFNESMGSILYIGGPLFYNLIESDDNGNFVSITLENTLDANFASESPYVREGIAPSYKTFTVNDISVLKNDQSQTIFNEKVELPSESSVLTPSENTNKCIYLPCIDTTGFATEFVEGEYYPQEALAFKAIAEMHSIGSYELDISCYENGKYVIKNNLDFLELDITNEPMVLNWISHIDVAKLPIMIANTL